MVCGICTVQILPGRRVQDHADHTFIVPPGRMDLDHADRLRQIPIFPEISTHLSDLCNMFSWHSPLVSWLPSDLTLCPGF